jgi:uncharacterized repeat protein (TIGR03803 family)
LDARVSQRQKAGQTTTHRRALRAGGALNRTLSRYEFARPKRTEHQRGLSYMFHSHHALPANIAASAFLLIASSAIAAPNAPAAGFNVIHNFTNGTDGGTPSYTLTLKNGALFGTTFMGGNGYGTAFGLFQKNNAWHLKTLYDFTGDQGQPAWGDDFHQGSIYTSAMYAEVQGGPCGTALQLDASGKGLRTATPIHTFVASVDGCNSGNMISDGKGNLYGTTQLGGPDGGGVVYELTRATPAGSKPFCMPLPAARMGLARPPAYCATRPAGFSARRAAAPQAPATARSSS